MLDWVSDNKKYVKVDIISWHFNRNDDVMIFAKLILILR
jgi:hypothetical protein